MKIPILLITHDRPNLLQKILTRLLLYTNWDEFELWILDNNSTSSNRKIISAFKERYSFINIFSSYYNQIALIQNEIISKLKRDLYIKLDDDILVPPNWTNAFVNCFNRNYSRMSFGSVIIPVNGFGWVPYLKIMNLENEFNKLFPKEPLVQDCIKTPVWNNPMIQEYLWKKSININKTTEVFLKKQNYQYKDLICNHRYSIGAIVFSHKFWEGMGGWKLDDLFYKRERLNSRLNKLYNIIKWISGKDKNRLRKIFNEIAGVDLGFLGIEEQYAFDYSKSKDLIIPVTTEGIVYHFAFGTAEEYLMKKIFLDIDNSSLTDLK